MQEIHEAIISGISASVYPVLFSSCSFIGPIKEEGKKKKHTNFPFPHNKPFPNFALLSFKSIQMIGEATLKQGKTVPQYDVIVTCSKVNQP